MKKLILICCCLTFFMLNSLLVQAQKDSLIVIDEKKEMFWAGKKAAVFSDTSGKMTIEDIIKPENKAKFQYKDQNIYSAQGFNPKTNIWLKLHILNPNREKVWIEVGNTLIWYVDYYQMKNGKYELAVQTGSYQPQTNKAYPTNLFWLPINRDSVEQTVYIRTNSIRNHINIPILVGTDFQLQQKKSESDFYATSFIGVIAFIALYNLFLGFSTRDKTYFWYVCEAICLTVSMGHMNNYPFFTSSIFDHPTNQFLMRFTLIWFNVQFFFRGYFVISFLDTKLYVPKYFNFFFKSLIWFLVLFLPISLVIQLLPFSIITGFLYIAALAFVGTSWIIAIYIWLFKKQKKARLFVLGYTINIFWTFIQLLGNHGHISIEWTYENINFRLMGTVIQELFFALALADRINVFRDEKEKAQAETLSLVQNQNQMLEQKVKERTIEVEKQKDLLVTANEELTSQQEQIYQQNAELHSNLELVFSQNQAIEYQNKKIKKQNLHIVSSINYALRIQKGILPSLSEIQKSFTNSFILYKPKDIVSGDFYWFADKGDTKILAVVDCTGHGVPGAFMTMIGNNILNQIIHDLEIYEPNKILNMMPLMLAQTLKHSEGKIKDGMDMVVLSLYQNDNVFYKARYAGAMNPLYYVQNKEIKEIKASKMPISADQYGINNYQVHDVDIDQTSTFYLVTDGYQDQFGGQEGRKFMVKRFRELLLSISEMEMDKQAQILENTIEEWMQAGRENQTDDIAVLGIQFQVFAKN
ncbi:MAG: hypothetical protein EAZ97_16095 [Bacteroidetes bacterium]|nr:MAG: hypothetical protein EAZ97_16095 [Bacteroidota bacterium]